MIETIKQLPDKPGVYKFFDKGGQLLYIGKAKNLKKRVKSYFRFNPLRPAENLSLRIKKMISEAKRLEYIVVENESDALILENSLIKQLKPKYNILLRDDKTYPYIYIDLGEDFPRFEITRKVVRGKNIKYFGPFVSGAKEILETIYEEFPLVQSKSCLNSKKVCIYYQMNRCLGPCEDKVSKEEYRKIVDKAISLIKDKEKLIEVLNKKMQRYSNLLQFEEAAKIRDRIKAIKNVNIYSNVDFAKLKNIDVIAVEIIDKKAIIQRIFIREGKVISTTHSIINSLDSKDEIYKRAILEYYNSENPFIANEILVNEEFESKNELEEFLKKKFKKDIKIILNHYSNLIKLAKINALEIIKTDNSVLEELKVLFNLKNIPYRIEVFDTSHISGEASIGSMIVWEGEFKKSSYRNFHLLGKDEYSQMYELLKRRIESFEKNPPPELWVIDGGRAQLSLAKEIINSSGIEIDVIAISKEKRKNKTNRSKGKAKDKIYFYYNDNIEKIELSPNDKRLQFLQNLRDEAHRFAINFHRKTKRKNDLKIDLLSIKGIGKAKLTKLLNYFGSFENIKNSSFEELREVLNEKDAKNIILFFQNLSQN